MGRLVSFEKTIALAARAIFVAGTIGPDPSFILIVRLVDPETRTAA
jgi:hypothetical protein